MDSGLSYRKMNEMGLCYGPAFQRLLDLSWDDKNKTIIGTSSIAGAMENESRYAVHPAALDAGLQLSTLVMAAGNIDRLVGHVPIFMEKLTISTIPRSAWPKDSTTRLSGRAQASGFRSAIGDFDMDSPENDFGLQAQGVKILRFENAVPNDSLVGRDERLPYLRVIWKPDIDRVTSKQLRSYMKSKQEISLLTEDLTLPNHGQEMLGLVDLCIHKDSGMHILHVGDFNGHRCMKNLLQADSLSPRLRMYTSVCAVDMKDAVAGRTTCFCAWDEIPEADRFDLIIFSIVSSTLW